MKKVDYIHRIIAKTIDVLIVAFFFTGGVSGVLAGAVYIMISDGFFAGQSVGKKLIGLQVKAREIDGSFKIAGFRESIIRNMLFGLVVIFGSIPILGWFIFLPIGIVLILVELYFVYVDEMGIRLGDIFAGSQVTDGPRVGAKTTT